MAKRRRAFDPRRHLLYRIARDAAAAEALTPYGVGQLAPGDGRSVEQIVADSKIGRRKREAGAKHGAAAARRSRTWAAFLVAWKKETTLGRDALARHVWRNLSEVKHARRSGAPVPRGFSLESVRKDLAALERLAGKRGVRLLDRLGISPEPARRKRSRGR